MEVCYHLWRNLPLNRVRRSLFWHNFSSSLPTDLSKILSTTGWTKRTLRTACIWLQVTFLKQRVCDLLAMAYSTRETIRKEEEKEEQAREWSRQQKAARSVGGPLSGFGRGAPRTQTRDSAPTSPTPKTAKSQQPHPEPLTSAMPSQEPKDGLVLCISSESSWRDLGFRPPTYNIYIAMDFGLDPRSSEWHY